MSHSTADLVLQRDLGLRFLVRGAEEARDIAWVASSDLLDPTPFLEPGQLLLTTGRQFADGDDSTFATYVAHLQSASVVGIGFGTEVLRDGVPDGLLAACIAANLTLIEVPFRTPFLALIRWVAAEVERDARRREEWALEALRAVPAAALAGDVRASLAELGSRVRGSVLLIDRSGRPADPIGSIRPSDEVRDTIALEVEAMLRAGKRGGREVHVAGVAVALQTLGPGGNLAGVLVVLTPERLDRAAHLVVNAAVALLEVSIFHEERSAAIRRRLGDRALALAIEAMPDMARVLVEAAGGHLPELPLVVTASTFPTSAMRNASRAVFDDSAVMAGIIDEVVVAISPGPSWRRRVDRITAAGGRTGVSTAVSWESVGLSVDRARDAVRRATSENPVIEWEGAQLRALESATGSTAIATFAQSAIRAVLADERGEELIRCARTWLEHDGKWDATASHLGMHRHSLRARIRQIGTILALDLETFEGKVELHLLLNAR
jgi:PucR family transcriptional regulator, purine catabolism regulatory protein